MVSTNTNQGASGSGQSSQQSQKSMKTSANISKITITAEKDTEEYRRLRERNNEAVKKSRTKTKMRTQKTLDKVEKLRSENSKLEDKISGLKKELDLLKELFISHAGTSSIKRLTEGDLDSLIAEAMPKNKKKKGTPYTGRDRDVIEKEVLELLGKDGFVLEPLPSTSMAENLEDSSNQGNTEAEDALDDTTANASVDETSIVDASNVEDQTLHSTFNDTSAQLETDASQIQVSTLTEYDQPVEHIDEAVVVDEVHSSQVTEAYAVEQEQLGETTYAIVADGSVVGPAFWTTENGETVVVTIEDDGSGNLIASGVPVQQEINDMIQGEILMLE